MNIKIQAAINNSFEIGDDRARFLAFLQNKHVTLHLTEEKLSVNGEIRLCSMTQQVTKTKVPKT